MHVLEIVKLTELSLLFAQVSLRRLIVRLTYMRLT